MSNFRVVIGEIVNKTELLDKLETFLDDMQTMIDQADSGYGDDDECEECQRLEGTIHDLREFIYDLGLDPDARYSLGEMASFMLAISAVK